jgi:hypothetical protein
MAKSAMVIGARTRTEIVTHWERFSSAHPGGSTGVSESIVISVTFALVLGVSALKSFFGNMPCQSGIKRRRQQQ